MGFSGPGARGVAVLVALVLVTALLPVGIASADPGTAGGSATSGDHVEAVRASEPRSLSDADLERLLTGDAQTELVVRLEEAPLDDVEADETEEHLEAHAAETQEPLVAFVSDVPGITPAETFWVTNAVVLDVDPDAVDAATVAALEQVEGVEAVHENFLLQVPDPPGDVDPFDASARAGTGRTVDPNSTPREDGNRPPPTAAVERVNAPAVWNEYGTYGEGTRVAVLDSGVDVSHPDVELYTDDPADPTYPGGWAEFDPAGERVDGSTPRDTGSHGTHVSGTVAGGAASGTAIGVAPEADLLHGLVVTEEGGTFAQLVAGVEWAIQADADVINLSLGTTGRYAELIDPVRHATESGVVVVAAIGNDGPDTSSSPGNVYDSISVGATAPDDAVAPFSGGERFEADDWAASPADWPDSYVVPTVVAPGVEIYSAVPGGYARMPGTSMATPHVTGVVALLHSTEPDATPDELTTALVETAWKPEGEPLEQDARFGHGIVDARAAADRLAATCVDEPGPSEVDLEPEVAPETDVDAGADGSADGTPGVGPVGVAAAVGFVTFAIAIRQDRP